MNYLQSTLKTQNNSRHLIFLLIMGVLISCKKSSRKNSETKNSSKQERIIAKGELGHGFEVANLHHAEKMALKACSKDKATANAIIECKVACEPRKKCTWKKVEAADPQKVDVVYISGFTQFQDGYSKELDKRISNRLKEQLQYNRFGQFINYPFSVSNKTLNDYVSSLGCTKNGRNKPATGLYIIAESWGSLQAFELAEKYFFNCRILPRYFFFLDGVSRPIPKAWAKKPISSECYSFYQRKSFPRGNKIVGCKSYDFSKECEGDHFFSGSGCHQRAITNGMITQNSSRHNVETSVIETVLETTIPERPTKHPLKIGIRTSTLSKQLKQTEIADFDPNYPMDFYQDIFASWLEMEAGAFDTSQNLGKDFQHLSLNNIIFTKIKRKTHAHYDNIYRDEYRLSSDFNLGKISKGSQFTLKNAYISIEVKVSDKGEVSFKVPIFSDNQKIGEYESTCDLFRYIDGAYCEGNMLWSKFEKN